MSTLSSRVWLVRMNVGAQSSRGAWRAGPTNGASKVVPVFPGTVLEDDSRLPFSQPLLTLTASNTLSWFPVTADNICCIF